MKSDWLELQSALCADPPAVSIAVIGLDERRQLERNVCDLINKRDRLIAYFRPKCVNNLLYFCLYDFNKRMYMHVYMYHVCALCIELKTEYKPLKITSHSEREGTNRSVTYCHGERGVSCCHTCAV